MHKGITDFNAGKWIKLIKDCSDIDSKMVGHKKKNAVDNVIELLLERIYIESQEKRSFSVYEKSCQFFPVIFYSLARYDKLSK